MEVLQRTTDRLVVLDVPFQVTCTGLAGYGIFSGPQPAEPENSGGEQMASSTAESTREHITETQRSKPAQSHHLDDFLDAVHFHPASRLLSELDRQLVWAVADNLAVSVPKDARWHVSLLIDGEISPSVASHSNSIQALNAILTRQGNPLFSSGVFVIEAAATETKILLVCNLDADYETVVAISSLREPLQSAMPDYKFKIFLATSDRCNDLSISVVNRGQQILSKELDGVFVIGRRVVPRGNIMKPHRITDLLLF